MLGVSTVRPRPLRARVLLASLGPLRDLADARPALPDGPAGPLHHGRPAALRRPRPVRGDQRQALRAGRPARRGHRDDGLPDPDVRQRGRQRLRLTSPTSTRSGQSPRRPRSWSARPSKRRLSIPTCLTPATTDSAYGDRSTGPLMPTFPRAACRRAGRRSPRRRLRGTVRPTWTARTIPLGSTTTTNGIACDAVAIGEPCLAGRARPGRPGWAPSATRVSFNFLERGFDLPSGLLEVARLGPVDAQGDHDDHLLVAALAVGFRSASGCRAIPSGRGRTRSPRSR